mgnify:CR=1
MVKIFIGLFSIVTCSVIVAMATHWMFGIAIVVLPILITFIRLKIDSHYRNRTNVLLENFLR